MFQPNVFVYEDSYVDIEVIILLYDVCSCYFIFYPYFVEGAELPQTGNPHLMAETLYSYRILTGDFMSDFILPEMNPLMVRLELQSANRFSCFLQSA